MDYDDMECYPILHWLADMVKPNSYLEIGVREGASLSCILAQEKEIVGFVQNCLQDDRLHNSDEIVQRIAEGFHARNPGIKCALFDNWSSVGGEGGEARIRSLLYDGFKYHNFILVSGDSKETVPAFFKSFDPDYKIDLVFVDGDHCLETATKDLDNVLGHFKVLVVHDLQHPQHGYLMELFTGYCKKHRLPYLILGRNTMATGVAFSL